MERAATASALSLIAGGIFTHGLRAQEQSLPAPALGRFKESQVSPRLGLLWEPRQDLQAYANYSRSHELPGFVELAQLAAFVPLQAQRAWTAEIGLRGRLGSALLDLSLYDADVRGELLQFSPGGDIPATTFNAGRTRHAGIEASLDLALAPQLRLRQVYQYASFRYSNDAEHGDNRLPVVPTHLHRAELRLGDDALFIAPSTEWVPQGAFADHANSLRLDGYLALGLTAGARLAPALNLFLDARNLAGTRAVGDVSAAIRADPQSVIFHPIERRAVFASLRARL